VYSGHSAHFLSRIRQYADVHLTHHVRMLPKQSVTPSQPTPSNVCDGLAKCHKVLVVTGFKTVTTHA